MARPHKRMQHIKELAKERKRKRNLNDSDSDRNIIQEPEEPGWDSSEVEEDVTAVGLLQQSAGSVSNESDLEESEDDELEDVLVSEGEELEEVDESAFGRLMASAVEQSRYVWVLKCLLPMHFGLET